MPKAGPVLRSVFSGVKDLFFPPRCAACGELLPPFDGTAVFCSECRPAWNEARLSVAENIAVSATVGHVYLVDYHAGRTDGVPERFVYHLKHVDDARAFAFAANALTLGVEVALTELKTLLAEASPMDGGVSASLDMPPIITHPPRRAQAVQKDGFDQAARLACALSRTVGGEFRPLLRRVGLFSREQKRLGADRRMSNAAASYALRRMASDCVRGRVVILCDDVCTTGATLAACTQLLTDAGARAVLWVTVARTYHAGK